MNRDIYQVWCHISKLNPSYKTQDTLSFQHLKSFEGTSLSMKMLFSISLESHQQAIRVFMHLHRFTHYCFGCCTSGQCSDYNSNEHSEKSQELFCSCGINIFCAIPQLKMLFIFHLLVFSKSKFELPGKQWFCGISLRQTSVPDPAGNSLELSKNKMNQFFSFLTCLLETFSVGGCDFISKFPCRASLHDQRQEKKLQNPALSSFTQE